MVRQNQAGQRQLMRDPDVELSIFDNDSFLFYLLKYCEFTGVEALISATNDKTAMQYSTKIKVIEYIVQ